MNTQNNNQNNTSSPFITTQFIKQHASYHHIEKTEYNGIKQAPYIPSVIIILWLRSFTFLITQLISTPLIITLGNTVIRLEGSYVIKLPYEYINSILIYCSVYFTLNIRDKPLVSVFSFYIGIFQCESGVL